MAPRRPQQPPGPPEYDSRDPRNEGMFGGGTDMRGGIRTMPGYTMPGGAPGGIRPWPHGAPASPYAGNPNPTFGATTSGIGNTMSNTHTQAPGSNFGSRHNASTMPELIPGSSPPQGMHPDAAKEYTKFQVAMQEVLAEEPDPAKRKYYGQVYQDFLSRYSAYAKQSTNDMNRIMSEQMRTRGSVDPLAMEYAAKNANHTFIASFNSDLDQRYGPGGREAWNKLHSKMSGPGVIETIGSNFYSKEKAKESGSFFGGLRLGGIAGGALGLFAGLSLFSGHGIIGYVAAAVMAVGFGYGGNQIQKHFIDGDGKQAPATPGPTPSPTAQTPELALGNGKGAPDLKLNAEPPIPAAQVASQVVGTMPSGITSSNVSNNYQPVAQSTPVVNASPDARQKPAGYTPS